MALALNDWSAYRHTDDEDSPVFLSAAFSSRFSRSHFPELQAVVGEALPSLGVHPLLPSTLKHFGFACGDTKRPAYGDLVCNFKREWAWSLCIAFMSEVSQHRRTFVQPVGLPSSLGRVASSLPDVPLHHLDHGSPHVPWSHSSVLYLMHSAGAVPERNLRPWTDYATGCQSLFLAYDFKGDGFAARPNSPVAGPPRNKGGLGTTAREARRKRYRDLESHWLGQTGCAPLSRPVTIPWRVLRFLLSLPSVPLFGLDPN